MDRHPIIAGQSEETVAELLSLLSGSDSVELKLTVPDSLQRATADALGLDPLKAQIRQVVFFDTPDLALDASGVVVRARRIAGGGGDTVVKLRPVVPARLPEDLRRPGKVSVELDAMPGGYVCSASMKGKATAKAVRRVIQGRRPTSSLFSGSQTAFFAAHAPEGVALDDLVVLGPINILKLKFSPAGFGRSMVAELWLYPDGGRILELSGKCAPPEAFDVAAQARSYLASRGVSLDGEQQTKTRTALEYFSRGAREASPAVS